jgi:disulfide bond formation protein DsbB
MTFAGTMTVKGFNLCKDLGKSPMEGLPECGESTSLPAWQLLATFIMVVCLILGVLILLACTFYDKCLQ